MARDWPYSHGPKGACSEGCPRFARCHCGCKERPKRARWNTRRDGTRAGEPFVWVRGHNRRVLPISRGAWEIEGIPIEKVRPLAHFLRRQHGGYKQAAEHIGLSRRTLTSVLYATDKRSVTPRTAAAVADGVLSIPRRSRDPHRWAELSVLPRLATEEDARLVKRINHAERTLEHQYNIRATKGEREERLGEVKRRQRAALSIRELVG